MLWALRYAMAHVGGNAEAEDQINRGFELADVMETRTAFWALARVLAAMDWSSVWHAPCCCSTSSEELLVLQAIAESGERHRSGQAEPAAWWRLIVPPDAIGELDRSARAWIEALEQAGVVFPRMNDLIESLEPLHAIARQAASVHLN